MPMSTPPSRRILLIVNTGIGHISHRSGIQPLVLDIGAAFQLCVRLVVSCRAGARPVAMRPTFASLVDEGAEEEAGYWGTGGEKDAVVFDSGVVNE